MKRIDFKDLQKYLHEIPNQLHSDDLLKKIHSMDVHTAYALLGGFLVPLLRTPTKVTIAPKLLHLEEIVRANVREVAYGSLRDIDSRIPSKLPQIEEKMKEILEKLKEYYKKLPKEGHYIDRDAHYKLKKEDEGGAGILELYEELYYSIQELCNFIKNERLERWEIHPELRKKYSELLSLFSLVVQPWDWRKSDLEHWIGVLPPEATKFLIKDLEEALKGLYNNRKEEEERIIKDLEDRIKEIVRNKDNKIGDLNKKIEDLTKNENSNKQRIKVLEKQISDLEKEKDKLERDKSGEITNLKERLTELERKIEELEKLRKEEIDALQKELKKVLEKLRIKEKEIKDKKIDEMGKELPELQKLLKDLEDGGIDLKDLVKLRDKLDDLNRLTKDEKDAVKDLDELQKNIKDLREELKKQKEIELEKQKKEKEILERENKLDDLQREILKLRRELENLESLKGKDLTNLREKLDKLEKLQKEVGGSNDKVKELEEEINRLRRELDKDKKDELDRQKEIADKEKEIEQKKKEDEINKIKEIELEELKKKRGKMDAYVFMIVVFLTQLHTKQAEKLKTHGETLQKVSRIFDQWNVIQRGLNTISQNANLIIQWIKEGKVDSNYNLYTDSNLSQKETDPRKVAIWNTFKSFLTNLQKNVKELRKILDEVRPHLPDSAKSLLDTMYKLSGKLLDIPDTKDSNDLTSYLKVTTESEKEAILSQEIENIKMFNKNLSKSVDELTNEMAAIRDDIGGHRWHLSDGALKLFWPDYYKKKQKWNEKHRHRNALLVGIDKNKKSIEKLERELREERRKKIALPDTRLTILDWISDSDQTRFKAYMDNIAQGITALTSISNMTQQELQIDTQYYNSLLGLQKAGLDSLTRTVQGIIANIR